MFIKKISIEGFKSYKRLHFTEEFSPEGNLIIGLNGHGKSNLLNGKQAYFYIYIFH
jgi:structural maintenance of chromosome 3 (chondroitin sulfate proteoglycan 6)